MDVKTTKNNNNNILALTESSGQMKLEVSQCRPAESQQGSGASTGPPHCQLCFVSQSDCKFYLHHFWLFQRLVLPLRHVLWEATIFSQLDIFISS